jgi:hypothetical protein
MEIPNSKLQIPKKLQNPSSKVGFRAAVRDLRIGISLEPGIWDLEL